jgi:hypothetical protein
MNNLEIMNQLLQGCHLEKEELLKAKQLLHGMTIDVNKRIALEGGALK